MLKHATRAFTMAEVLIVLALLGVIAAFTLPKIIQSQAQHQKVSILKEAYSAVSSIAYKGIVSGEFMGIAEGAPVEYLAGTTHANYFFSNLNALQICRTVAEGPQCRPTDYTSWPNSQWVVLPNGATIMFGWITDKQINLAIDYNGSNAPNEWGADMLDFDVFYRSATYAAYNEASDTFYSVSATPGQATLRISNVHPVAMRQAEKQLWNAIIR